MCPWKYSERIKEGVGDVEFWASGSNQLLWASQRFHEAE